MADAAASPPAKAAWDVGALVQAVAESVAERFAACTVQGELSGFSRAASGHCYFTLKDSHGAPASIRCAMFRRASMLLDFKPADGQQVQLRGRLGVYEARGELQLVVEAMRPLGAGALFEQFLRLKARLEAQGLFDPARKRPLPAQPRAIGIVTSLGAAALRDVVSTLVRRAPHVRVVIYPSPVQGTDAAPALVEALALAARRGEVDLLILCRGGGSIEDLWSFNDERLVRAIVASPLPVVCGVGHETDFTLADLAADLRAATPTAAAELAAPERQACLAELAAKEHALSRRLRRSLDAQAQALDSAALRLARPAQALQRRSQQLEHLAQRLTRACRQSLALRTGHADQAGQRLRRASVVGTASSVQRLASLASRLDGLAPQRVLARGYAWLVDAAGVPVQSVVGLRAGDALQAVLHDGRAEIRVEQVERLPP